MSDLTSDLLGSDDATERVTLPSYERNEFFLIDPTNASRQPAAGPKFAGLILDNTNGNSIPNRTVAWGFNTREDPTFAKVYINYESHYYPTPTDETTEFHLVMGPPGGGSTRVYSSQMHADGSCSTEIRNDSVVFINRANAAATMNLAGDLVYLKRGALIETNEVNALSQKKADGSGYIALFKLNGSDKLVVGESVDTFFPNVLRLDSSLDMTLNAGAIKRSIDATITASTTQTQGQFPLTKDISRVSAVANANDTVTMAAAAAGLTKVIINDGANTLQVFPASGDNLGAGLNMAITMAAGSVGMWIAYDATNWKRIV